MIEFMLRRSGRERFLLGLLGMIILPLAVIFVLLLPLQQTRDAARVARAEAQALQEWVYARAAEQPPQVTGVSAAAPQVPPIGSAGIEAGLIAAGLRGNIAGLDVRDGGVIVLRFDVVEFVPLANWISDASRGWGYDITGFHIQAGSEPGLVAASLTLTPPPG